ncbi:tetratricopeptide repeat protein, partial [Streptomyces scabiei]
HLLGVLALQVGRPDAAAELIERALHQVPGHPGFLSNLGEARRCLGDLPAALACFRQALARDPAQVEARINAGLVLAALGRAGDSVAAQ